MTGTLDLAGEIEGMQGRQLRLRLIKAAIKSFAEYCEKQEITLPARNFALRYETDIPRQVGLAGSSAIVTSVFRALMEFYQVSIPREFLPNLTLAVETGELSISAGLQDRVTQVSKVSCTWISTAGTWRRQVMAFTNLSTPRSCPRYLWLTEPT